MSREFVQAAVHALAAPCFAPGEPVTAVSVYARAAQAQRMMQGLEPVTVAATTAASEPSSINELIIPVVWSASVALWPLHTPLNTLPPVFVGKRDTRVVYYYNKRFFDMTINTDAPLDRASLLGCLIADYKPSQTPVAVLSALCSALQDVGLDARAAQQLLTAETLRADALRALQM